MGAPYSIPGYDAWKLATPWDHKPTRLPASSTVTTTLCIETADVTIDAYATYSADSGELVSVRVNGREMPPPVTACIFAANSRRGVILPATSRDTVPLSTPMISAKSR